MELTVATQVLGPYVLTAKLAPLLWRKPGATIVTVSSGGMYTQRFDLDRLEMGPTDYDGVVAYARAKRAQLVLAEAWARGFAPAGVSSFAMHPGWVDTPGLEAGLPLVPEAVAARAADPRRGRRHRRVASRRGSCRRGTPLRSPRPDLGVLPRSATPLRPSIPLLHPPRAPATTTPWWPGARTAPASRRRSSRRCRDGHSVRRRPLSRARAGGGRHRGLRCRQVCGSRRSRLMTSAPALLWFRRDLRLDDLPALHAGAGADAVVPLFVIDPSVLAAAGPNRRRFLAEALRALDEGWAAPWCCAVAILARWSQRWLRRTRLR